MAQYVITASCLVAFAATIWLLIKGRRLLSWFATRIRYTRLTPGSSDWRQAEGRIESAEWNYKGNESSTSWPVVEVAYSFEVEGERYANVRERPFKNSDAATDFVNEMRDRGIVVRYDPRNPNKSAIEDVVSL